MPAIPVNDDVGLDAFPRLPPVPLTILQVPVPTVGVLPPRFIVVRPQVAAQAGSGPALAVVGGARIVTVVVQVEILHASLTVHVIVDTPTPKLPLASLPVPLLGLGPVISKVVVVGQLSVAVN